MDTYRKTLLLLKDLLHEAGNTHWEHWIDKDIYDWDNCKSTIHHKQAFGGMGSINDIAVGGQSIIGAWQNNMFDLLKNISWTFATKGKIDFPRVSISNIEGVICRNCEYSEIAERAIDHFISLKHLPKIIEENLKTGSFPLLSDFDKLTTQVAVVHERQILHDAVNNHNIHIKTNDGWLQTCPSCKTNDMIVYRWDVTFEDDKVHLNRSKDNLSLRLKKTRTDWVKRLMGFFR